MAMNPTLVEQSFGLVAPRADALANRFYQHLFRMAPDTRALFARADMERQKRVLLATLVVLVKSLRNLDTVLPAVRFLGKRHLAYGVRPEHYTAVGAALLQSMAEMAGTAWRPEYTTAWAEIYGAVKDVMLSGLEESFAGPVATLEREQGLATSESQDVVALEIHGRARAITHRAADLTEQTAALRAQFRASMEAIARDNGVPGALWRSTASGAAAPEDDPQSSADPPMAQMKSLYEQYPHRRVPVPINGKPEARAGNSRPARWNT